MSTTYVERAIDLTVSLGKGSFGESGADKVTFRGMRIFVEIEKATATPAIALIRVYGLSLSRVNQLTKAGLNWEGSNNTVLVEAGDKGGQLKAIFEGQIFIAEPDFGSPDTSLVITANATRAMQLKPVPPNSFKGGVSTETVISKIVKAHGYTVENNGVQAQLDNPYFPGTTWSQLDSPPVPRTAFFSPTRSRKLSPSGQRTAAAAAIPCWFRPILE
jgi:hypothetical protein